MYKNLGCSLDVDYLVISASCWYLFLILSVCPKIEPKQVRYCRRKHMQMSFILMVLGRRLLNRAWHFTETVRRLHVGSFGMFHSSGHDLLGSTKLGI